MLKVPRLCVLIQHFARNMFFLVRAFAQIAISGYVYISAGVVVSQSGCNANILLREPVALGNGRPVLHGYVHVPSNQTLSGLAWPQPKRIYVFWTVESLVRPRVLTVSYLRAATASAMNMPLFISSGLCARSSFSGYNRIYNMSLGLPISDLFIVMFLVSSTAT
jgi:hypothetical protein